MIVALLQLIIFLHNIATTDLCVCVTFHEIKKSRETSLKSYEIMIKIQW